MYVRSSGYYTPMYRSEATFTVTTSTSDGSDGSYNYYYDSSTADQLAKTFPYILSSDLLTDAMKEDLGTETIMGSVSAQTISQSNMVTMSAVSSDPEEAKRILESAIRVYPDVARFVNGILGSFVRAEAREEPPAREAAAAEDTEEAPAQAE